MLHSLLFTYFNAFGLSNKLDELKVIISSSHPDVIAITETHLNDNIPDSVIHIDGYNVYRCDRTARHHGGVAIYIKCNLTAHVSSTSSDPSGEWESLWCTVSLTNNSSLNVGCIYRIPSPAYPDHWSRLLSSLNHHFTSDPHSLSVCLGDFNFPAIDWTTMTTKDPALSASHEFLDFLLDHNLHQHVNSPTRHRRGQKSSLLDLVVTTPALNITAINHYAPIGRSDHDTLCFTIDIDYSTKTTNRPTYNFKKADYTMINEIISSIDWDYELQNADVDTQLSILSGLLQDIIQTFVPLAKSTQPNKPPWSTPVLRTFINKKKRLYRNLRGNPTPSNMAKFQEAREEAIQHIQQARDSYESNLIHQSKTQPKLLFSYINKNKKSVPASCLKNEDGTVCLDDNEIASIFNRQFASHFGNTSLPPPSTSALGSFKFTEYEVYTALENIKSNSACGPDGLSPIFVKQCASSLARPLFHIYSNSIKCCHFPSVWKEASVTPIFKSGSPHIASNYRPISLLPVLSKILERFVYEDILDQCSKLKILPLSQHGFLPRRSCLTNLLSTYDTVTRWLDSGNSCDIIFFDFSKAFDCVSHTKLLYKLQSFGFKTSTVDWIHSSLYARRQRAVLRGSTAQWTEVTSGVPQGSVLGPLLFNIFISDLPAQLVCDNQSYADDLKIFAPSVNSDFLQRDVNEVVKWATHNSLTINLQKCAVIHLGSTNPNVPYTLGSSPIPVKTSHNDLGTVIDSSLKFNLHAELVVTRLFKKAHFVLKSFKNLSCYLFSVIYKSFLRPILDYCSQVCRPRFAYSMNRLESCQRRLTKWCTSIRHLPYERRLQLLGLQSVRDRFLRGDLILAYKITHELLDIPASEFFVPLTTNTRGHPFRIRGECSRRDVRHNFFTERVTNLWNELPALIVCAPTLNCFKSRLDSPIR